MRGTGRRVAFVASSSWSHAFLNDKDWHLRPDTPADRRLYDALVRGDIGTWTSATGSWSDLVTTDVFNSNKCFAIYRKERA